MQTLSCYHITKCHGHINIINSLIGVSTRKCEETSTCFLFEDFQYTSKRSVLVIMTNAVSHPRYTLMYCPFHVQVKTNFRGYFVTSRANKLKLTNSPRSFQVFRRTLRQKFKWIRKQMKNSPIDPDCKNRSLSETSWRCRKWADFTIGVYGKFLHLLWVRMKFRPVFVYNFQMIEVSLSSIGRDLINITPKIRFHLAMKRTVALCCRQLPTNFFNSLIPILSVLYSI